MKRVSLSIIILITVIACSDDNAELQDDLCCLGSLYEIQMFIDQHSDQTTYDSREEAEGFIVKDRDITTQRPSCGQVNNDGTGWVAYQTSSGSYKLYAWDDNTNTHTIMTISPAEFETFCG